MRIFSLESISRTKVCKIMKAIDMLPEQLFTISHILKVN